MYDITFRHIIDWGLGFLLNSNQYGPDTLPYGYGPHASYRTFGHNGHQSATAFADPERQLVVAPRLQRNARRTRPPPANERSPHRDL